MALHTRVRKIRQRHLQLIAQLLIKRQRLKAERIHQHMAAATRPRLSFRFIHQLAAQAAAARSLPDPQILNAQPAAFAFGNQPASHRASFIA